MEWLYDCDFVINMAAETHVGNSIIDSDEFLHWHTHFKRFGECRKQEGIFTVSGHYMVDAENSFTCVPNPFLI